MSPNVRLLVVEDEEDLNEILQFNLESEGYLVDTAFSAEEALQKDLSVYHLMILDVMMGKLSGFNLAHKIRKEFKLETPFIFLTARNAEMDLLTGFNLGADDYMTKPFSIRELQARIKAVLKRTGFTPATKETALLKIGELTIDPQAKRLTIKDKKIEPTRKEFDLLSLMIGHPGRIFSREEIMDQIWDSNVIVMDRSVDVHITRLRRKLEEYGNCIRNKTGFGYYFEL